MQLSSHPSTTFSNSNVKGILENFIAAEWDGIVFIFLDEKAQELGKNALIP